MLIPVFIQIFSTAKRLNLPKNTLCNFFKNNNKKVSGGAFTLKVEDNATKKVWTSGQDYTSMTISAYTDSSFEVSVYIRAGYYVDKNNVQITDASGIIVSTSEKSEENVGVVVAVGQGKLVDGKREPMTVKVNDRVIFEKYSANEIEYKNEKYLLIPESKILAIVE